MSHVHAERSTERLLSTQFRQVASQRAHLEVKPLSAPSLSLRLKCCEEGSKRVNPAQIQSKSGKLTQSLEFPAACT
eukprot:2546631-Amphidinium_carterae.1